MSFEARDSLLVAPVDGLEKHPLELGEMLGINQVVQADGTSTAAQARSSGGWGRAFTST